MNIAFDISPLRSQHQFRGIGFYTKNLIESLEKIDKKNNYYKFNTSTELPADIDLIHYPYFDLFQRTLKINRRVKIIVTVHDLTPLVFPQKFPVGLKGKINWFWQKKQLADVNAVITDSFSSKKDIAKIAEVLPAKIHVVYLAPSNEFRKLSEEEMSQLTINIRKKYKINQEFILYVGDINWNKNVLGLIEAFAKIRAFNRNINLLLVGKAFLEDNLLGKKEIDKKIESLKLENHILRTGFIPNDDLIVLYNLAKVYIQPSFYEGFGLPVLEAMSCGTPVVCSNVGSLPEIVGDAVVLVDPKDVDDIKKGIEKILNMSNEEIKTCLMARWELRNEGIKQAAKFTWEKTARETIQVYEKIYKSAI